jgi:hypothetical protein
MSDYPDLSQNLSKQNKIKIKFEFSYFLKIRMDKIWIKFRLNLDKIVFFFKISLGSICAWNKVEE